MNIFEDVIVTDIISAIKVTSIANKHETISNREYYGLSFCMEGQITYLHNGREYVSDKTVAIILPKGQSYSLYRNKNGIFPVINFDTLKPLCTSHQLIPINDASQLLHDFSLLRSCLHSENDRAKAMSIFYGMIHKLSGGLLDLSVIAPAVDYIKQNFDCRDITNTFLADLCGISEVYFRRLFSEKLGTTPRQYIIDLRLARAKELLSDGTLKISAISESCGFTNPYHFTRTFKEKTGITPGEYMRENRVYKL